MSLTLTNRLDKLENEIRIMLMLQKCGCQRFTQGTAVTTSRDGNIKEMEISTNTENIGPRCSPTQRPSNKNSYPLKYTVEYKKGRRPYSPLGAPNAPSSSPEKDYDKCSCKKERSPDASPEGVSKIPTRIATGKQKRVCKCRTSPSKELEMEQEKRKILEDEIEKMKLEISELSQSKCMAMTMTKQLKKKYEKVKSAHDDTTGKLDSVTREKDFLCRCLEREREYNARDKRSRGDQVEKPECICTRGETEEKIKTLQGSLMSMSKTVQEKDEEKRRLELEKEQMQDKLKKHKDVTKRLSATNEKLAKSVKKKHDSFITVRNKAGKIQKEIDDYKSNLRNSQLEIIRLKNEMDKKRPKDDDHNEKDYQALEDKLKKCKEKEKKASEVIQLLKQKIRDFEFKQGKATEKEMQKQTKELMLLQAKYDEAAKKLRQYEDTDSKRSEALANEMRNLSANMIQSKEAVLKEKEEMNQLVAEMTEIVKEQKLRIDELQSLTEQQESMIQCQKDDLLSKENQIKMAEMEAEAMREKYDELDQQLDGYRAQDKETLDRLNAEIEALRKELESERSKSTTKDQVIEEQYNTIQSLKEQVKVNEEHLGKLSSDARQSQLRLLNNEEAMQRMSRELSREKDTKKSIVKDLTAMQKRKENLESKVSMLEEAYERLSQGSVTEKDPSTISGLKSKYESNLKQWEDERKKLIEERDRAINAANMATETLMETMNDFQGQIKSQQQLQKIMTDMIVANTRKTQAAPCKAPCHRSRTMTSPNIPGNMYPYAMPGMYAQQGGYPPLIDPGAFYGTSSARASTTESPTDSDEIPLIKCSRRLNQFDSGRPTTPRPISPACRCANPLCRCEFKRPCSPCGSHGGSHKGRTKTNACSCKKRGRS